MNEVMMGVGLTMSVASTLIMYFTIKRKDRQIAELELNLDTQGQTITRCRRDLELKICEVTNLRSLYNRIQSELPADEEGQEKPAPTPMPSSMRKQVGSTMRGHQGYRSKTVLQDGSPVRPGPYEDNSSVLDTAIGVGIGVAIASSFSSPDEPVEEVFSGKNDSSGMDGGGASMSWSDTTSTSETTTDTSSEDTTNED